MIPSSLFKIFKNGSVTYFYSSLFFPNDVKEDVFALYSFVRTADDFVDQTPPQAKKFRIFRKKYELAVSVGSSDDVVINSFIKLSTKRKFNPEWVKNFLDTMELDLTKKKYQSFAEIEEYMYGSAEVIGLMMAKILNLPEVSYLAAQSLGKSMQYINFIRDVREDLSLGRTYFPQSELRKYKLQSLELKNIQNKVPNFTAFIHSQIAIQKKWCVQGEKGYKYIPKRYLIPIKTANDLYTWSAQQIAKNPLIVFEKKVKPSALQVITTIVKNIFYT